MTDTPTVRVHVLRHGRALCPQPGVPSSWPEGHKWVGVQQHELADCVDCKYQATVILAEEAVRATRHV